MDGVTALTIELSTDHELRQWNGTERKQGLRASCKEKDMILLGHPQWWVDFWRRERGPLRQKTESFKNRRILLQTVVGPTVNLTLSFFSVGCCFPFPLSTAGFPLICIVSRHKAVRRATPLLPLAHLPKAIGGSILQGRGHLHQRARRFAPGRPVWTRQRRGPKPHDLEQPGGSASHDQARPTGQGSAQCGRWRRSRLGRHLPAACP